MQFRFQPVVVVASANPETHKNVRAALKEIDCAVLDVYHLDELLSACQVIHPNVVMIEPCDDEQCFSVKTCAQVRAIPHMADAFIVVFGAVWDSAVVQLALENGADDAIFSSINDLLIQKRMGRIFKVTHHEWQITLQNSMLAQMAQAVFALDLDLNVLFWNPAAERLYGMSESEMMGQPYTKAFRVEFITQEQGEKARQQSRSSGFNGVVRHLCHDGRVLDVHVTSTPIRDATDHTNGYVLAVADITEQTRAVRAEEEQRALADALRESVALLTKSLNEEDVMRGILHTVGKVVPHDAANIMFIEGDSARIRLSQGYSKETHEFISTFPYPIVKMPIMRQVMMTGVPRIVEDVRTDPDWVLLHELPEWRSGYSFLCAPIKSFEQVIGFINLDLFDGRKFSRGDADRLHAFADQVAIAVTNARLFETVMRDAEQVRHLQRATSLLLNNELLTSKNLREVCAQIAQVVVEEFGTLDCGVMLVDDKERTLIRYPRAGQLELNPQTSINMDSSIGLVPEAVRTAMLIYAPDVKEHPLYFESDSRTRCELVIPLISNNRVLGVIDLQSEDVDSFKAQDRATLQAFAKHVSVVIDNILLINEIRTVNEQLEARVIERTFDLNRIRVRVESILNSVSDTILLVSVSGTIQQANPAFERMFGHYANQGQSLSEISHPDSWNALQRAFQNVLYQNTAARLEMRCIRADGSVFDGEMMIAPMLNMTDDDAIGMVCSIRDVSEQKQLSRQLEMALGHEHELVEMKSMFIRYASHELRTPMTIIQTSADILLMFGDRKPQEERALKLRNIQQQVTILKDMLDKLFELNVYQQSERTMLKPIPIDLAELSEQIQQWAQDEFSTHHPVYVRLDMHYPFITADERALDHILKNLIMNAVKFSEPGSPVECLLLSTPEQLEIRVSDVGIGIPEEHAKHLFEPFYRIRDGEHLKYNEAMPGSGLGLTLVKQATDLHNGRVWFEPNIPHGTTFIVQIPNTNPELTHSIAAN